MMKIVYDDTFKWKGFGTTPGRGTQGEWESKCRLRIYQETESEDDINPRVVVIATELDDNDGTSITNSVENIATLICRQFEIDPVVLVWIEHYPDRNFDRRGEPEDPETFDLVHMELIRDPHPRFAHPRWSRMKRIEVEELIAQPLDRPPG